MNDTMANLTQFARRWPYCVACAVLTVLLGAGAWFLRQENHNLEAAYRVVAEEGEAMVSKLFEASTLRQELEEVRAITERIDENLVIESNLADNLLYFYRLEDQTKAKLPELHQVSSPTNDKSPLFRRVPYGLRVTGTYEQVAALLLALETGPRVGKVTSFNCARTDLAGSAVALDLNLELLGRK